MAPKFDIGNESECGSLVTVIMHRPGQELLRLRKDNLDQLLFDEIPNIGETHKSHDIFTKYLRDRGVQVLYVKALLLSTLKCSVEACHLLIDGIVAHSLFNTDHEQKVLLMALREWLLGRTPEQLVQDVIGGVACTENELGVSPAGRALLKQCDPNNEFVIPPLPNLMFTRDAFSIIEKNVFIWHMAKPARQNEPLIFRVIFQYHPQLSTSGLNIVEWQQTANDHTFATIEGGDVAYIGQSTLLIGSGERTNQLGIEALARTGLFRQVIAVTLPPQRDYMHLDTVLSSVGKYAFTLHKKLANKMEVFIVQTLDMNNNILIKPKWISYGCDICQALEKLLNDPGLIFYDAQDEETSVKEQQQCRHNVLALGNNHVITYAGGDSRKGIVAEMMHDNACEVGLIPTEGLLEGCGGMHCMTNAIRRRR